MTMLTVPCAGCGQPIGRIMGDSDINSEFCGKCNAAYYESHDDIAPEDLAKLENLSYESHKFHAINGCGESDELGCRKCYPLSQALAKSKNLFGNLPSKINHPEPLWVRTLRRFLGNIQKGAETGKAEELERMRRDLAHYERQKSGVR